MERELEFKQQQSKAKTLKEIY